MAQIPLVFGDVTQAELDRLPPVPAPPAGFTIVRSRHVKAARLALLAVQDRRRKKEAGPENEKAVAPRRVAFNLFPDVSFEVEQVRARFSRDLATYTWFGRDTGSLRAQVVLSVLGDQVDGNIANNRGDFFQIRHIADGIHEIRQVEYRGTPAINDAVPVPESAVPLGFEAQPVPRAKSGPTTIDLLAVYTQAARDRAGSDANMLNNINLTIAETNQGYLNSGIQIELRLAHAALVTYDDSVDISVTLTRLRGATDGYMDELHALRNQYGADVVSLIINGPGQNGGVVGIGYVMAGVNLQFPPTWFEAWAFGVSEYNFAAGPSYTFAHELGHNQGAQHDRANAGTGAFSYSYGYQNLNPSHRFRTNMSYGCASVWCPTINHWSNPDISYAGDPTGIISSAPDSADNRMTLNNTAVIMASFRSEVVPPTSDLGLTMNDTPDPVEPGGTLSYSLTVTNAGPDTADDVTLTDTLPTEAAFVSATGCTHSGEATGGIVTCDLSDIASGGSEGRTLQVTAPTTPGVLSLANSATVAVANSDDPDTSDDTAAETTAIEQNVDLTLTSAIAPMSALLGGTISVSAGLLNQGNAAAGLFRVGFYFSTNATITTGDVFSGFSCLLSSLTAEGTDTCGGSAPVPVTLAPGAYYFGAVIDDLGQVTESNEANNSRGTDTGTVAVTVPPLPSPVAVWSLEETGTAIGTVLADASGNGHHATTQGASTYAINGASGNGRAFRGVPASAQVAAHPNLSTSNFSMALWVKLEAYPSGWGVIYSNYGGDFKGWFVGSLSDGRVIFCVAGLPSSALWLLSSTSLQAGQWHHVAITFNGATRGGAIYIDGALDRSTTFPSWTPQTAVNPTFAKASWYGGGYLAGNLDEVKLFSSELLAQQISSEFSSYTPPLVRAPVASWAFEDMGVLPGSTLADSSGNGHNAQTTGVASVRTGGVSGAARSFNGFPNHATLTPHADLSSNSFSFSTWVKLDSLPSGWGVIYSNYGGDFKGWYVGVYNDGRVIFTVAGLPSSGPWLLSNGTLTADQWHHVTVTFDGAIRRGSIYFDGALDRVLTFPAHTPQTTTAPTFGRASWYNGAYLEATFDEAKLFTAELTSGAVIEEYSAYTPPAAISPVAQWSLDEWGTPAGTVLADGSGNGHSAVTAGLATLPVAGVSGVARDLSGFPKLRGNHATCRPEQLQLHLQYVDQARCAAFVVGHRLLELWRRLPGLVHRCLQRRARDPGRRRVADIGWMVGVERQSSDGPLASRDGDVRRR